MASDGNACACGWLHEGPLASTQKPDGEFPVCSRRIQLYGLARNSTGSTGLNPNSPRVPFFADLPDAFGAADRPVADAHAVFVQDLHRGLELRRRRHIGW